MMYETMEMRQVFANELDKAMAKNKRICLIDADLCKANGRASLDAKYPKRAFNVGVAEANMISIAAGMSSYGMIPFVATFTPFATRRVCDQIAISCLYAQQNVKIIGSDPGLTAEYNGGTHMSVEDIGVIRSIPNIVIFEPVDNTQLVKAFPQILKYVGTMYIRMFRKVPTPVFKDNYHFDMFSADIIETGKDVTIIASGIMVSAALEASKILKKANINAEIINAHTIKPIDINTILASVQKTKAVVTCENHNIIGGLYSAVAEALSANDPFPMEAIGIKDRFGQVGKLNFLLPEYEMTPEDIVKAVIKVLDRKR
ncbi:MAG: transketolase C-terminal domain-containing protein [Candidatus Izemoplasmatales bacterium]|nr:transketolase C-terminal domain-containing protein [Candidatus Izemoplasmatales bacterium]MDD3864983.1 transketolase C-terminal domain-containing protein [Candidatus Izemoplasmatales bacterium]